MKDLLQHLCAACAGALLSTASLQAQTGETVLDYQFIPGAPSGGGCITADPLGNVFTGCVGYPPTTGFGSGLVLQTDTNYAGWLLSDDSNPAAPQYGSEVNGLGFDASGNLFSVGTLYNPRTQTSAPGSYLYVRWSPDRGTNWYTVDTFQYASGKNAGAATVAVDAFGNVLWWAMPVMPITCSIGSYEEARPMEPGPRLMTSGPPKPTELLSFRASGFFPSASPQRQRPPRAKR